MIVFRLMDPHGSISQIHAQHVDVIMGQLNVRHQLSVLHSSVLKAGKHSHLKENVVRYVVIVPQVNIIVTEIDH